MARKYKNVQGSNDFLIAAIGLALLGLWGARDAWFPTPNILEKHPQEAEVSFEYEGNIAEIIAGPGNKVSPNSPIARISVEDLDRQQQSAESRLKELDKQLNHLNAMLVSQDNSTNELKSKMEKKQEELKEVKREIAGIKQTRLKHIARSEYKGKVKEISVKLGDQVEVGDIVAVIDIDDHFYDFNKSLAIGGLLGAIIFAIIHIKLK